LRRVGEVDVGDDDIGAGCGQDPGDARADAACATCFPLFLSALLDLIPYAGTNPHDTTIWE
jgi:hypothetical protein